ncbi:MAG: response regulator [Planctomycetes bacterium]|nr:response regulator [Planctomycetota bacterium]
MLERQLCQWGWRATALDRPAVATATLAAAAAAGDPYDVALIDATMPDGDGIQFAKSLRDPTVQPQPRTVLITSVAGVGAAMHDPQLDAVITKPIRGSHLLELLRSLAGAPRAETAEPAPRPRYVPARTLAGLRVLVAEDNEVNRMVVMRVLKKLGLRADAVASGDAAVVAVATKHYDLVLMDGQMSAWTTIWPSRSNPTIWLRASCTGCASKPRPAPDADSSPPHGAWINAAGSNCPGRSIRRCSTRRRGSTTRDRGASGTRSCRNAARRPTSDRPPTHRRT